MGHRTGVGYHRSSTRHRRSRRWRRAQFVACRRLRATIRASRRRLQRPRRKPHVVVAPEGDLLDVDTRQGGGETDAVAAEHRRGGEGSERARRIARRISTTGEGRARWRKPVGEPHDDDGGEHDLRDEEPHRLDGLVARDAHGGCAPAGMPNLPRRAKITRVKTSKAVTAGGREAVGDVVVAQQGRATADVVENLVGQAAEEEHADGVTMKRGCLRRRPRSPGTHRSRIPMTRAAATPPDQGSLLDDRGRH